MIADSSVIDVSGSMYVLIPKAFADYFKLKPDKCKIEDLNDNEARITFTKW